MSTQTITPERLPDHYRPIERANFRRERRPEALRAIRNTPKIDFERWAKTASQIAWTRMLIQVVSR